MTLSALADQIIVGFGVGVILNFLWIGAVMVYKFGLRDDTATTGPDNNR